MSVVQTNLASIAEEYSEISNSLHQFLDSLEGSIETIKASFNEGQLPEIDALVTAYYELEGDLEDFDSEVDKLLKLLDGSYEPDSVDEIEEIERSSETLIRSINEFGDTCEGVVTAFSANGLEDQAAAFRDVADAINTLPGAIQESLLDNHLLLALKADNFPGEVRNDVGELIEKLQSAPADHRQNIYGVLLMVANQYPAAVEPYTDDLADRLAEEPPAAQQNLLTILTLAARSEEPDNIAKEQALDLLDESNPGLSVAAASLLAEQTLMTNEAERIASRMKALFHETTNQPVRKNSTFVLYTLATSHPQVVLDHESDIASLLNDQNPGVVENTIGILGKLGSIEYADKIAEARENSDDPEVRAEAEEVLNKFNTSE